jgi:hypothetical protein
MSDNLAIYLYYISGSEGRRPPNICATSVVSILGSPALVIPRPCFGLGVSEGPEATGIGESPRGMCARGSSVGNSASSSSSDRDCECVEAADLLRRCWDAVDAATPEADSLRPGATLTQRRHQDPNTRLMRLSSPRYSMFLINPCHVTWFRARASSRCVESPL